jgi:phospholipid/cholesterol/gamma-HCH transport system substrate-binding protein
MRAGRSGGRLTPLQAGAIALLVIALVTYLAATKDLPFTRPFELTAVFDSSPPIKQDQRVRIAGVDVGKVSRIEPLGGDSHAVAVTMKLEEEALPIHRDAEIKVRPRIFFEGNLFFDIEPGTPAAGEVEDGDAIPASQTSAPVQIDQVLGTLEADTRADLQKLLIGYGDSLDGAPRAGEDADQDADTKGETAGEALNDSLRYSADALRGGAIASDAALGSELHDLSRLVAGQQRIAAALSSREVQLQELITNFNTTMAALAGEEANLRATVRELPRVLEAARPALDELNEAFPPTRAWALEMIPGLRETPATIDAAFPWIRQVRALVSPQELQGLVDDLQPAVDDFAQFVDGQVDLLPQLDLFARCQLEVILPTLEQRISDGPLTTGLRNYEEFFQTMVSLAGESQNFDGSGNYVRFQAGGGGYRVQTAPVGLLGPLHANASARPLGTRPARGPKPPYRPRAACHRQPVPNLDSARIGGGP